MQPFNVAIPAPAKLNLFLHIIGQRADGYHQLQTIFQLLDYGDTLEFSSKASGGISLSCDNTSLQGDDNLIIKAAKALQQATGSKLNAHIHLNKVLPMGGGIGGGSSDCATTLLALNQLFGLNLPMQQLLEIGAKLGADVPVFILGKTAWAEGIGEQLTPLPRAEQWYLVLHPNQHVSTVELFKNPDLTRDTPVSTIRPALADTGHNDFEPLVRSIYPTVEHAFQAAQPFGQPRLTGTGSCLFLTMQDEMTARNVLTAIARQHPEFSPFIAKGVCSSPAHKALKALAT
ncbi:4-(cytidine 5'-diphospho)-2-C-methyl-D-erythritol kinase [Reinekea marinisedimentorum]|uniref:4-diphosphocytidyl-2-C-methyl-D-erythritol kinase n=1 Tax=Reinekea marinisedimentorum TaxID=230495 RepID=A0A4R3IAI9_9GAMM|nr:4-(cytidine 5'-diphospho)-2-C-methyl-D-erythritol kinase [Reinekea marinisedimentorum]TCS41390.1 4-diphosphocytidyl-2-C-methyl-D-erythritol kinase [Reinekea marinisedimentorum]